MKIMISVDIEGVAGVCEPLQGQRGNPEYETARRLMTEEANAAVRGAFAGGATEVTVADSHGPMRNIIASELDPRAISVMGRVRPLSMIQGVCGDCAGVVLIGYHASASNRGILAHTISSLAFSRIEMNGTLVGEPTLYAGYAAEVGVPLLAVSGDDRLMEEIRIQFPNARRLQVKKAISAYSCESLAPSVACSLIEREVQAAVAEAGQQTPSLPCKPPLEITATFTRQIIADAASLLPITTRKSALEVAFTAPNYAEAIGTLSVFSIMSQSLA